jgi:hypothetical protein
MKKSITVAAMLMVGAAATGASAALTVPYQGSDTLFNVTRTAITNIGTIGPASTYVGGGSGNGQSAMAQAAVATATQQTAPMSRMINNSAAVCAFNGGTAGSADTSASGIVIGLDAVDVLSNNLSGAQTGAGSCNGTGGGLAASGTSGVFGTGTQNWKWILALVYGGKDLSSGGVTDCNSTARQNLVANWSKLFQAGCTPSAVAGASGVSAATTCGAGSPANGALWHAFRRDEASGTSDVFASILGLSPNTSTSVLNGFGASPYCNALNWDATAGNATCQFGDHDQFIGPGGIIDPLSKCAGSTCGAAGSGNHRKPPTGVWGDAPDPGQTTLNADVLPTQMQDNDPIRRPCLGGATNVHARSGEEVCNLDGALGLVVPMVDTDWVVSLPAPNNKQYPVNNCTGFSTGKAPTVFTCAARGTAHSGECPNGDQLKGGACGVPIDGVNHTSQCVSSDSTFDAGFHTRTLPQNNGRAYNLQMRDGSVTGPTIGFLQYQIPALGTSVDMTGAFNRIHQVETAVGAAAPGCQMIDMTDQIGCLVAEDPCSIGYAGDASKTWATRTNGFSGSNTDPAGTWDVGALQVAAVVPNITTVQALGTAPEYQLSRKLYLNSLVGFGHVAATTGDPGAADEITLAKYEAIGTNINPILTTFSFFPLGAQSPAGTDTPFCEDFNEQTICGAGSNANGCTGNPTGIPTASTTCGNGVLDKYEECDGTVNAGTGGCSLTCRCVLDFNPTAPRAGGGVGACN